MEEDRESNSQFVHSHRGRFAFSVLNRIVNYWTGAWVRPISGFPECSSGHLCYHAFVRARISWLVEIVFKRQFCCTHLWGLLAIYPIVYYFTTSQPRFYHAITPLLILLGAYFVIECFKRVNGTRGSINSIDGEPLSAWHLAPTC